MIIKFFTNIAIYLVRFLISILPGHYIDIISLLTTILSYSNQVGNFFHLIFR